MRQAIHIFRKDVRHCWPYAAVALALTAAPLLRLAGKAQDNTQWDLAVLPLAAAWWLAIRAVVREERPAGESQFWVTRPYSWRSLLAAKILFLAVFLGLPVFLSDCIVLHASGFDPVPLIPGLLLRQGWLAGFLALPFTVAALTRTTGGFVLAGLACYAGPGMRVLVLFVLRTAIVSAHFPAGGPEQWLLPAAGVSLAAWQYARRRTVLVRGLGIALAAVAAAGIPFMRQPSTAQDAPSLPKIAVLFDSSREHPYRGGKAGLTYIPIEITGWPRDMVGYHKRGTELDQTGITPGTDGKDWLVLDDLGKRLLADTSYEYLPLAVTLYERVGSQSVRRGGGWVRVDGFGSVRWQSTSEDREGELLMARTALGPPGPKSAIRFGNEIADADWRVQSGVPAAPMTFRLSPVYMSMAFFRHSGPPPNPASFTAARVVSTGHLDLEVPQIRLADYEVKDQ
jgi:hypothetical protein